MPQTPRQMRLSSTVRGAVIGVLIAVYVYVSGQPDGSFAASLLLAVALQIAVLAVRRLVPADNQPAIMYIVETIADGLTVLLFALAIYGGMFRAFESF